MKCLRVWAALYGMSYVIKADSGPSFRSAFEKELKDLGVINMHNSLAYHPQIQGLVERLIRMLKDILNENKNPSQLQLNEHIYAINCNEDKG